MNASGEEIRGSKFNLQVHCLSTALMTGPAQTLWQHKCATKNTTREAYQQLSTSEQQATYYHHNSGESTRSIAKLLGMHHFTVIFKKNETGTTQSPTLNPRQIKKMAPSWVPYRSCILLSHLFLRVPQPLVHGV